MLVRTGVHQGMGNSKEHPADFVVADVLEAVETALRACHGD